MSIKALRNHLTDTITDILFIADPMGLSGFGCPDDEYDIEARMITERLIDPGVDNEADLAFVIKDTFRQKFTSEDADEITKELYARAATSIWLAHVRIFGIHNVRIPAVGRDDYTDDQGDIEQILGR